MRTEKINQALVQTISTERLGKYIKDQGDNVDLAIGLYEKNIQLSAAFYPELQALEVSLRSKIHTQMQNAYGAGWLLNKEAPLEKAAQEAINEVWDEMKKPQAKRTSGDIVAELKFSFWIGLLGPKYDETTWRKNNHKAFPNFKGKRSVLQGRLNMVRRFRNRIAHHEPIFHKDRGRTHQEIIEAIGWMCEDTKEWAMQISAARILLT